MTQDTVAFRWLDGTVTLRRDGHWGQYVTVVVAEESPRVDLTQPMDPTVFRCHSVTFERMDCKAPMAGRWYEYVQMPARTSPPDPPPELKRAIEVVVRAGGCVTFGGGK